MLCLDRKGIFRRIKRKNKKKKKKKVNYNFFYSKINNYGVPMCNNYN